MSLDKTTVRRIAFLARLHVSEEAMEPLIEELSAILDWVQQLEKVDTTNINPIECMETLRLYWREDSINDGGYTEEVLANAPESIKNFFVVPKVIE